MKCLRLTLIIVVAASVWCGARAAAAEQPPRPRALAGRPLADVLRDLQARGVPIVFSSELVRPTMRVGSEPSAVAARQVLDQILTPHGLATRPGPRGTLIVVRARVAAPSIAPPSSGATIRGLVVDGDSATPLPGVLVRVSERHAAASVTDEDGRFELTGVPPGRHTLFASLVGYTVGRPSITVVAGGIHDLTVSLAAGTATYSEEVTVTADPFRSAEQNIPSAIVITGTDLLELRGVLSDDPLRAVQALPAVASSNDFRSEFSVRGADYRHVGLSIDGMTVDWPVHTVRDDAAGGSVSLINSDVVDSVALFAGAYRQDRPARTGAWIDFTIREGSRARLQARGALSMTTAALILEGPIGSTPRGSWLVATRQSYVQWILRRMGSDGTTAFGYTDIQGKAVYDVSPSQRVDLTVITGRSQLDLRRIDTDPNLIGRGVADAILATAGWRLTRGSKLTVTQRASASRYGFDNNRLDGVALSAGTGMTVAYRGGLSWSLVPSTLLQVGTHVQRDGADQLSMRFIELPAQGTALSRPQRVDAVRSLWSADARVSYAGRRGFTLDGGALISQASNDAASPAPSPWFAVTVPFAGRFSLRTAAGIYRQHPSLDQTGGTFGTEAVRAERSTQLEIGLEHRWRPDVRLQIVAYGRRERDMLRLGDNEYRLVEGIVVPPSMAPRWSNVLDGSSSGVEVVAQRRAATGLTGWVSYSYSHTRHHDRRTGEAFDADFDQGHAFGAYAHYRVSGVTSISARIRAAGNVPIPGYFDVREGNRYVGEHRNTVRLKTYSRVDLRANRAFNFDSRRLTLFVEVVNVLGRTNYAPGYDAIRVLGNGRVLSTHQRLFPFLPAAGILVEF